MKSENTTFLWVDIFQNVFCGAEDSVSHLTFEREVNVFLHRSYACNLPSIHFHCTGVTLWNSAVKVCFMLANSLSTHRINVSPHMTVLAPLILSMSFWRRAAQPRGRTEHHQSQSQISVSWIHSGMHSVQARKTSPSCSCSLMSDCLACLVSMKWPWLILWKIQSMN